MPRPKPEPRTPHTSDRRRPGSPVPFERTFTRPGEDPFQTVRFEHRTARIEDDHGRVVFEQKDVEVPVDWSQTAGDLVASRYFAGIPGRPGRESSVKGLVGRVVRTLGRFVRESKALESAKAAKDYEAELAHLLLEQKAAFNSPVWFNVGLESKGEKPQCSACFILSVEDRLESILDLASIEGRVFSKGSGAGTNFSKLRGAKEPTRAGGTAAGPVAFLRGLDALAGAVKSGGRTRRAAKMAILDADHPDAFEFVRSKALEEARARALEAAGLHTGDVAVDAPVSFQNENHSLRVTDAFLRAVEHDGPWTLVPRTALGVPVEVRAHDLFRAAARAAHACGDPGLHFVDEIESWNPVPRTGPIRASNPCSEFLFLDDTACNLASINVLAFLTADGEIDHAGLDAAATTLILAMDAIVENASYPTPTIERNSHRLRPLGLGVANLGALLLALGLPYDSAAGRALAAHVMSIVAGAAARTSAQLAVRLGAYAEWDVNRFSARRVLKRHADAAEALPRKGFPAPLSVAARVAWHEAVDLAAKTGLRNAQLTCIAPTGTISFLMDCDTTGIEPLLALVQERRLVGGGRLRLTPRAIRPALERLGYGGDTIARILHHIERTGSVEGVPDLLPRDVPVFDTALPTRPGARTLGVEAHLRMMAAVQPFLCGGISKTVNLPADASVADVERVFLEARRLGLKAVAVYRDRSKVTQPLSSSSGDAEARIKAGRTARKGATGARTTVPSAVRSEGPVLAPCAECGTGMVPAGSCFVCRNCGSTTGCG